MRLPSRNKNTNIGWVLKIANRGINESSNTVSAILIWPAATRQSWHYPPRLESVSSGGEPRQFGNIEVDNYSSIISSSTVTFAVIIKVQSFFDVISPRISEPSKRQVQLRTDWSRDVNVSESSFLILQTINEVPNFVVFGNIFCVSVILVNEPEYRSRYGEQVTGWATLASFFDSRQG